MTVTRERDIAYNLLETGRTGEHTPQLRYDQVGSDHFISLFLLQWNKFWSDATLSTKRTYCPFLQESLLSTIVGQTQSIGRFALPQLDRCLAVSHLLFARHGPVYSNDVTTSRKNTRNTRKPIVFENWRPTSYKNIHIYAMIRNSCWKSTRNDTTTSITRFPVDWLDDRSYVLIKHSGMNRSFSRTAPLKIWTTTISNAYSKRDRLGCVEDREKWNKDDLFVAVQESIVDIYQRTAGKQFYSIRSNRERRPVKKRQLLV